jgi:tetratricopeptide (TPR) repeat protein
MLRAGLSYCIPASLLRTWLTKSQLSFTEGAMPQPNPTNMTPGRQAATFAATAHLLHAMGSVLNSDSELLDLSIHHYEAALRLNPERSDVLRDLALAWVAKNELERARTIFDRALVLTPRDSALLTDAADLRRRLNMTDAAASLYREALRQDACFARASFGLGVVLKGQGRMEEAAESFRRLAQCPPSSSFATYRLGLELEQQGQHSTALHVWNNFLRRADRVPSNELPILTKIRQRASQLRSSVERSESASSITLPASPASRTSE